MPKIVNLTPEQLADLVAGYNVYLRYAREPTHAELSEHPFAEPGLSVVYEEVTLRPPPKAAGYYTADVSTGAVGYKTVDKKGK